MTQYCFTFKIKPEMKDEYKRAHDNIWPEFAKAVREAGFSNQSIFYKSGGTIIIYFESDNPEKSIETIARNPLNIKWQKEMEKFLLKEEGSKSSKFLEEKDPSLKKLRPGAERLEQIFFQE